MIRVILITPKKMPGSESRQHIPFEVWLPAIPIRGDYITFAISALGQAISEGAERYRVEDICYSPESPGRFEVAVTLRVADPSDDQG
jgi:hypothetical protein